MASAKAKLNVSAIPVLERALIARINRALAKQDEILKTARGAQVEQSVGRYYTINVKINGVTRQYVDLEKFGRELGVLKNWERMERVS